MAEYEIIKFEIAKLELAPGDILVVKMSDLASFEMNRLGTVLSEIVPNGVRVLIVDDKTELSVLTRKTENEIVHLPTCAIYHAKGMTVIKPECDCGEEQRMKQ